MMFSSMMGGSGGLAAKFLEETRYKENYDILAYCLFPSVGNDLDANLVSPYNFVLNYNNFLDNAFEPDSVVAFSNNQLKRHCFRF